MFIKAVREDFTNKSGDHKYEVGKEYKNDAYYFTDEKNIGAIPESGFSKEKLLKTRFLQIEPVDPPYYDTSLSYFTSEHIKVIREIPIAEVKNIFKAQGMFHWFIEAEEESKKNRIQNPKNPNNHLKSIFKRIRRDNELSR